MYFRYIFSKKQETTNWTLKYILQQADTFVMFKGEILVYSETEQTNQGLIHKIPKECHKYKGATKANSPIYP